jgi:hypothetical protein
MSQSERPGEWLAVMVGGEIDCRLCLTSCSPPNRHPLTANRHLNGHCPPSVLILIMPRYRGLRCRIRSSEVAYETAYCLMDTRRLPGVEASRARLMGPRCRATMPGARAGDFV